MKKNYLLVAGLASMMAFTACSNDDDLGNFEVTPGTFEVVEGATFEISINGAPSKDTKAVRPVGSSAADNSVNVIKLMAYYWDEDKSGGADWVACTLLDAIPSEGTAAEEGKIGFVYTGIGDATNPKGIIEGGMLYYGADIEEGVPGTDVHINKKAQVQVVGLSEETKYQFVAYGFNNEKQGTYQTEGLYPYKEPIAATETNFENGIFQAGVSTVTIANPYELQEIFAATDVVATTKNDANQTVFTQAPSLTLERQVAGILAYFKAIPARMNKQDNPTHDAYKVEELRVVASHKSKDFYFPAILLDDPDFNGIAADNDETEDLIVFDFSEIATNYATSTLDEQSNYEFYGVEGAITAEGAVQVGDKKPFAENYAAPAGLALKEGSIFGARYIMPYDKHYSDETTLKLQFWGTSTVAGEDQTTLVLLEERDITTPNTELFDAYTYDIRCNNFYSIGQKLETDDTDGPDDEDDTDDDDEPIDLRSDKVNVRINDAWAVLHNMGVDNIE